MRWKSIKQAQTWVMNHSSFPCSKPSLCSCKPCLPCLYKRKLLIYAVHFKRLVYYQSIVITSLFLCCRVCNAMLAIYELRVLICNYYYLYQPHVVSNTNITAVWAPNQSPRATTAMVLSLQWTTATGIDTSSCVLVFVAELVLRGLLDACTSRWYHLWCVIWFVIKIIHSWIMFWIKFVLAVGSYSTAKTGQNILLLLVQLYSLSL